MGEGAGPAVAGARGVGAAVAVQFGREDRHAHVDHGRRRRLERTDPEQRAAVPGAAAARPHHGARRVPWRAPWLARAVTLAGPPAALPGVVRPVREALALKLLARDRLITAGPPPARGPPPTLRPPLPPTPPR